jgi:hypothetical protein
MSNALGEEDMVTARVVFHELWRMKMMEEALEYFFRLCMEYSVEVPSELIHTGIFAELRRPLLASWARPINAP